jgi:hypothetical protein
VALFDAANDCRDETRDATEAFGSATSKRQGEVINWLTMVTAALLPLTFVTDYFGMNFSVMTRLHGTLVFSLLAIALPSAIAVFSILLLRFLIRRPGVRVIPARTAEPTLPRPQLCPPSTARTADGIDCGGVVGVGNSFVRHSRHPRSSGVG